MDILHRGELVAAILRNRRRRQLSLKQADFKDIFKKAAAGSLVEEEDQHSQAPSFLGSLHVDRLAREFEMKAPYHRMHPNTTCVGWGQ